MRSPDCGEMSSLTGCQFVTRGRSGGSCGTIAEVWMCWSSARPDAIVEQCVVRTQGALEAAAAGSIMRQHSMGCTLADAGKVGIGVLGLTEVQQADLALMTRVNTVEDAFHNAIANRLVSSGKIDEEFLGSFAQSEQNAQVSDVGRLPEALELKHDQEIVSVVGMSGGVDSAVALSREIERTAGKTCGVTLELWIDPAAPDAGRACCSHDSVRQARRTCHSLGVAHFSVNLALPFFRDVVSEFINGYEQGETPNPCTTCNGAFRFRELVAIADALGARDVATGHYARKVKRGTTMIRRGVDPEKDQSYMLSRIGDQSLLERLRFPLGDWIKQRTRLEAQQLGLAQAKTADSQEICFLGGAKYRQFLKRAGKLGTTGDIVTTGGCKIGKHEGIAMFTRGQRRGIGASAIADAPLFVVATDPASGTVVVGDRDEAVDEIVHVRDLIVHEMSLDVLHEICERGELSVQLRYRAKDGATPVAGVENCIIDSTPGLYVRLDSPVFAASPGQVACFQDALGVVVASGIIARTS